MRENSESSVACHHRVGFLGLLITLGIVFGDIGTSPLYVMKAILHTGESHQREHHPGRIVMHHLDTHPPDHHQICMCGTACRQQWRGRHPRPLCPVAHDSRASGFTYWPSLVPAPCWQMESLPLPSRLPLPSKDSKASVPTCQSSPSPWASSPSSSSCNALAQRVLANRSEYSCCYGSCCWAWWELSASRLTH